MKTGVVIPSYNEAECITQLVMAIRTAVPDADIVVVDDSPNEDTADALKSVLNEKNALIRRKAKGGRGTAVIEGMRWLLARDNEIILEMDADFSHPPAQIPELVSELTSKRLDMLIASRYLPKSKIKNWPVGRHIFSFLANKLARAMLGVPVYDYTNGFRCYSRPAAELVAHTCGRLGTGFIALSEILVNLFYRGFKIGEVSTVFVNRVRGESSLNSKEILNALNGLFRIYELKKDLIRSGNDGSLAKRVH